LWFIVNQGSVKEFWKWTYKPEEGLIGLTSLTIETPPFELSVGTVILERQPTQLFQEVTREGPVSPTMKLLLEISQEEPGDKYWRQLFQKETQEIILARLLEGFS
jgi:hypothetical protein